jgi:putative NADPH-quinone reductase
VILFAAVNMTAKTIVIIQGHPDPDGKHFCHALAKAYFDGAKSKGHDIKMVEIAQIEFPILRTQADFVQGEAPEAIKQAQHVIQAAEHLVLIYPLWLGTMPAYLKAFLEQVFRPNFAANEPSGGKPWERLVTEKTAHIVITMGMPEIIYRSYFLAKGLDSLEGKILAFSGINTIQETLVGGVESISDAARKAWLEKMELAGRAGI